MLLTECRVVWTTRRRVRPRDGDRPACFAGELNSVSPISGQNALDSRLGPVGPLPSSTSSVSYTKVAYPDESLTLAPF